MHNCAKAFATSLTFILLFGCATKAPRQKLASNQYQTMMTIGSRALSRGDGQTAIRSFSTARRDATTSKQRFNANQQLAKAYTQQGKYQLALSAYQDALEANPKDSTARLAQAAIYEKVGQPDNAIHGLAGVLKQDSQNWQALGDLGALLDKGGMHKQAQFCYQRGLTIHSTQMTTNNYAVSLMLSGRFDQAVTQFKQALAKNSESHIQENLKLARDLQTQISRGQTSKVNAIKIANARFNMPKYTLRTQSRAQSVVNQYCNPFTMAFNVDNKLSQKIKKHLKTQTPSKTKIQLAEAQTNTLTDAPSNFVAKRQKIDDFDRAFYDAVDTQQIKTTQNTNYQPKQEVKIVSDADMEKFLSAEPKAPKTAAKSATTRPVQKKAPAQKNVRIQPHQKRVSIKPPQVIITPIVATPVAHKTTRTVASTKPASATVAHSTRPTTKANTTEKTLAYSAKKATKVKSSAHTKKSSLGRLFGFKEQTTKPKLNTAKLNTATKTTKPDVAKVKPSIKTLARKTQTTTTKPKVQVASKRHTQKSTRIFTSDEQSLLKSKPKNYTLVLVAKSDKSQLERIISENPPLDGLKIYASQGKKATMYFLSYGNYDNADEANSALFDLPIEWQRWVPNVKTYGHVQKRIRQS